jgi:hypothetical protein
LLFCNPELPTETPSRFRKLLIVFLTSTFLLTQSKTFFCLSEAAARMWQCMLLAPMKSFGTRRNTETWQVHQQTQYVHLMRWIVLAWKRDCWDLGI